MHGEGRHCQLTCARNSWSGVVLDVNPTDSHHQKEILSVTHLTMPARVGTKKMKYSKRRDLTFQFLEDLALQGRRSSAQELTCKQTNQQTTHLQTDQSTDHRDQESAKNESSHHF